MGLVAHAEFELKRAGLFDKTSDYDGELGPAILAVVQEFAKWGHSGGSAAISVNVLEKLLRFQPLTPITSDPSEWMCVTDRAGPAGPAWQNIRKPTTFSEDGGKTWYDLDDPAEQNFPPRLRRSGS